MVRCTMILALAWNFWALSSIAAEEPEPVTRGRNKALFEKFQKVEDGELPAGWTGDDSVGVGHGDGKAFLQAVDLGEHRVQSPPLSFPANFDLQVEAAFAWETTQDVYDAKLEIVLKGKDDSEDLTLTIVQTQGAFEGDFKGLAKWTIDLDGRATHETGGRRNAPNVIGLQRSGETYRISLNNRRLLARRISGDSQFERIELVLTGPTAERRQCAVRIMRVELAGE